jgi:hypothetical protein
VWPLKELVDGFTNIDRYDDFIQSYHYSDVELYKRYDFAYQFL